MADFNVLREALSAAQGNVQAALSGESLDVRNAADEIRTALDANHYDAPEVIYYHEGWDVVTDSQAPEPAEAPDFSGCESATAAVMLEANLIMLAAYDQALSGVIDDVAAALEAAAEATGCDEWIGSTGPGHLPHLREFDAGEGNVCHWQIDGLNIYQLTINGMDFTARQEPDDE